MKHIPLTAEQEAEAVRIKALLMKKAEGELDQMARLLASKSNDRIFGRTEFELRDGCHRIGAAAIQTVLDERKKGAT